MFCLPAARKSGRRIIQQQLWLRKELMEQGNERTESTTRPMEQVYDCELRRGIIPDWR